MKCVCHDSGVDVMIIMSYVEDVIAPTPPLRAICLHASVAQGPGPFGSALHLPLPPHVGCASGGMKNQHMPSDVIKNLGLLITY